MAHGHEMENTGGSHYSLLRHLDKLKGLFLLSLSTIEVAWELYERRKIKDESLELEFYNISVSDAKFLYFPEAGTAFEYLVDLVSFERPIIGRRVSLLEILTILAITVQAPIESKMRYLFQWYNFSKDGLLKELEHTHLIYRIGSCIHRMRMIGSIDLTLDDSRQMAIVARTYEKDCSLRFHPGLDFILFLMWVCNSRVGMAVFSFVRVFQSLINTLKALDNRTYAIQNIINQKYKSRQLENFVPPVGIFEPQHHPLGPILIFRRASSISIALPIWEHTLKEFFIVLEELIELPEPLYSVSPYIDKIRQQKLDNRGDKCCSRYYTKSSYKRIEVDLQLLKLTWPLYRCDIDNLKFSTKYHICAYTSRWRYKKIEVHTGDLLSYQMGRIRILPSSISAIDLSRNRSQFMPAEPTSFPCTTIFTGPVMPLQDIISNFCQSWIDFPDNFRQYPADLRKSILAATEARYKIEWYQSVSAIFSSNIFSNHHNISDDLIPVTSGNSDILLHSGVGPWSSAKSILNLKNSALLTKSNTALSLLEETLDHQFQEKCIAISRKKCFLIKGSTRFVFLGKYESKSCTASELILQLDQFNERELVIIAGSPTDLFDNFNPADLTLPSRSKNPPALSQNNRSSIKKIPKLTGKNEIIHGEFGGAILEDTIFQPRKDYSKTSDNLEIGIQSHWQRDALFHDMMVVLSNRLISCTFDSTKSYTVRVVFTAWHNGFNFEIKNSSFIIPFTNLLPTVSKATDSFSQLIYDRIIASLPSDGSLQFMFLPESSTQFLDFNCVTNDLMEVKSCPLLSSKLFYDVDPISISLLLLDGPRLVDVKNNSAFISVTGKGFGIITCSLYELPMHADHSDALSFILCEPRDELRQVKRISKRCVKFVDHIFRFYELNSYCTYCAIIEMTDSCCRVIHSIIPLVVHFRTLPVVSAEVNSFIIASVNCNALDKPSRILNRIMRQVDGLRAPSTPIYLINNRIENSKSNLLLSNTTLFQRSPIGRDFMKRSLHPNQNDIRRLSKKAHVIHSNSQSHLFNLSGRKRGNIPSNFQEIRRHHSTDLLRDEVSLTSGHTKNFLHIARNGKFCQISMLDSSTKCLSELRGCIRQITIQDGVDNIILFSPIPFLRYFRFYDDEMKRRMKIISRARRSDSSNRYNLIERLESKSRGSWRSEGFASQVDSSARDICGEIVIQLLSWKSNSIKRDCTIISTVADLKIARCVLLRLRSSNDSFASSSKVYRNDSSTDPNYSDYDVKKDIGLIFDDNTDNYIDEAVLATDFYQLSSGLLVNEVSMDNTSDQTAVTIFPVPSFDETNSRILKQSTNGKVNHAILKQFETLERNVKNGTLHSMALRHILLPNYDYHNNPLFRNSESESNSMKALIEAESKTILFPTGRAPFFGKLDFEVIENLDMRTMTKGMSNHPRAEGLPIGVNSPEINLQVSYPPRIDFQSRRVRAKNAESLIYIVDTTCNPTSTQVSDNFHPLSLQMYHYDMDYLEITVGPIIGEVTTTSAKIIMEMNKDLLILDCALRVAGGKTTSNVATFGETYQSNGNQIIRKLKTKAFVPLKFEFFDLIPGELYEIYVPVIANGENFVGRFRTLRPVNRFVEIAVVGDGIYCGIPLKAYYIEQLRNQQSIVLRHMKILNDVHYNQTSSSRDSNPNSWIALTQYLQESSYNVPVIFHLGSLTLFTQLISEVIHDLINHGKRLKLPLRDSSAIGALYFSQFEETVRDSFRVLWNMPMIRESLANGSHFPVYNSEYLLPYKFSDSDPRNASNIEERKKLLQITRKVFETTRDSYINSLYAIPRKENGETKETANNSNGEISTNESELRNQEKLLSGDQSQVKDLGHFTKIWQSGSMVVIILDNVSGRSKIPKSKINSLAGSSHPFSLGFIDKNQWKIIKTLAASKSVHHLVIISQEPFISLYHSDSSDGLGDDWAFSNILEKGDSIPWKPSTQDLKIFFTFWTRWMMEPQLNKASFTCSSRNVAFVSKFDVPYATLIQDINTGLKMQQVCVGNFNLNRTSEVIKEDDVNLQGKIGTLRFVHKMGRTDQFLIDSSRENSSTLTSNTTDPNLNWDHLKYQTGFGLIRFWFDSWRAVGSYQYIITSSKLTYSEESDDSDIGDDCSSKLLVGPVLGALIVLEDQNRCLFPILFEISEVSIIKITLTNTFTGEISNYAQDVIARRPFVMKLGPLDLEVRYKAQIVGGVRRADKTSFIISTHLSWSESNIAFLNCEKPGLISDVTLNSEDGLHENFAPKNSDKPLCSDMIKDITSRCKVPFSGINVIAHLNFNPSLDDLIAELLNQPSLNSSLTVGLVERKLSLQLFKILETIMERIKERFREIMSIPSYAELLKSASNIFIPSSQPVKYRQIYPNSPKLFDSTPANDLKPEIVGKDENDKVVDDQSILHLIHLMVSRISQEYIDQINFSQDNYLKGTSFVVATVSQTMVNEDVVPEVNLSSHLDPALSLVQQSSISTVLQNGPLMTINSNKHPVEVVFLQWLRGIVPLPSQWKTWIFPNGRGSIELLHMANTLDSRYVGMQGSNIGIKSAPFSLSENNHLTSSELHNNYPHIKSSSVISQPQPLETSGGVRIFVMSCDSNREVEDFIASSKSDTLVTEADSTKSFMIMRSFFNEWLLNHPERRICVIAPTKKFGSMLFSIPLISIPRIASSSAIEAPEHLRESRVSSDDSKVFYLCTLDSVYRSNEFDRTSLLSDGDGDGGKGVMDSAMLSNDDAAKKKASSGGRSKKAKLKREAEEKEFAAEQQRELERMFADQIPDGYVIIECRTSILQAADGVHTDMLSEVQLRVLGSLYGGIEAEKLLYENDRDIDILRETRSKDFKFVGRPSHFDYLQLPEWLIKYFPNNSAPINTGIVASTNGIFMQDEVILVMREDKFMKKILDALEDDEIVVSIINLYEKSRLSELSRPSDLRDVNLDIPGVIPLFLRELVDKIWLNVVPDDVKSSLVPFNDDLIRSFFLAVALPEENMLASSEVFARGMQKVMVMSAAMKTSIVMKESEKWKFIMSLPDSAVRSALDVAAIEKANEVFHDNAKKERLYDYDSEQVDAEFATLELSKLAEAKDYESDIDDLEKEEENRKQIEENAYNQSLGFQSRPDESNDKSYLRKKSAPMTNEEIEAMLKERDAIQKDAFELILEGVYESEFVLAVSMIAGEIYQKELNDTAATIPEKTFEERITESRVHMNRLMRERLIQRRGIGKKIKHLAVPSS